MPLAPDLDGRLVYPLLKTRWLGRSLCVLATTGSTNDDALAAARMRAPHGHTIVADRQYQGRGSHGRTWHAPPGANLSLSFVHRPRDLSALEGLTLAVGLGVARAFEQLIDGTFDLKWPNDVLVQDRKCAGILVESVVRGNRVEEVAVGIGINVHARRWPDNLKASSVALGEVSREAPHRAAVLARVLREVEKTVDCHAAHGLNDLLPALQQRLAWKGQRARCADARGTIAGVSARGGLLLRTETGLQETLAGRLSRE